MIPLFKVHMANSVDEVVSNVLHSGYIGEGDVVKEFEEALVDVVGNSNVLAVNSCTSALTMALRLAGVDICANVAATPMTCLATNEPILSLGADPVWVDVNPKTGNMCPESLERVLQKHKNYMQAILCFHWGGYPCDMMEITNVAAEYGIPVIEDAAHALGATYSGHEIGSLSDYTCFSFQAIKTITAVDGGAISFGGEDIERARLMRWFGLDRTQGSQMRCEQDPPEFGYKFHMNNLNAAIGIENLKHIDELLGHRRAIAKIYRESLQGLENVELLDYRDDRESAYWLFTILVDDSDKFSEHLAENGIASSKVHGRNDEKKIFSLSKIDNLPGVNEFYRRQVSIPIGFWLSLDDVKHIVDTIRRY